ncbi:type III secretion system translocon subunit SctE (plasmid) [Arsenophonus nasoniae]|uniref:Secreted effector protein SseC n=1 Tax=Arsenophonus nasoniae TaxID=638 RepID=A0A4P7L0Q8_9GAMM|nr:type III secretion system translocon subunit SctE [Arsenophonus nasoniae]QBY43353.1 Secreted effector protein SseC [Arsenophonus nasoniae]QBY46225.1 Secreted effector protein SseC [Arsenophonus nasoniae]WGM07355.1 type III secretion system translocon subunit SctE [Arsenophonus nasoniae]WGM07585.1 type III secretion system translocon subunit SctE [Arsenophonus nasoniae]WGM08147.1 type III secretion system translocon subunit SctE [Arsenophonus nasoniae]
MNNINVFSSISSPERQELSIINNAPVIKSPLPQSPIPNEILLNMVGEKKTGKITYQQADEALGRVLTVFHNTENLTLKNIEKVSINDLFLLSSTLSLKIFGDTANSVAKASKLMTDTQAFLRDQNVKAFQEELAKKIEQSEKNKWLVLFDWIVGVAEIAYGAVLTCLGQPAGPVYIAAGVAGIVKAIAETAIYFGIGDKEMWQKVADAAFYVQTVLEVGAVILDVCKAGALVTLGRGIMKGTQIILKEMIPQLTQAVLKNSIKEGFKAMKALAEKFYEMFVREIMPYITKLKSPKNAIEAGATILNGVTNGGLAIAKGSIYLDKAGLQKEIEELMLEQNFFEFCFDWYDKMKEQQQKTLKNLVDKQADSLEGASKNISETGMLQARIASSIV